jgi:D-alanyl-D-alanine carboxypeptidase/D-alanyl-D-alanine-endopeptidase (penicillin-binding protein 4)
MKWPNRLGGLLLALALAFCGYRVCAQETIFAAQDSPATPSQAAPERTNVPRFRERAETILKASGTDKVYWGALIIDADTGETLYALNAERYFKPASTVKLFTSAMALAALGPSFRSRTTIESTGLLDGTGLLRGDLVLVGRGDANLSNRVFPFGKEAQHSGPADQALVSLAEQVVAHGVKQIRGDIVADDSYFELTRYPSGWTVDDTVWSYGAAVSAIAINDNALTLEVLPGARVGLRAQIAWNPWPGLYSLRNQTRTVAAGSADAMLSLARDPESKVFVLGGTVAARAPVRLLQVAVPEPAELAAVQLKKILEARGVKITGRSRARHAGEPDVSENTGQTKIFAERFSPTLAEDLRLTNKLSQNLHAELMLRVAARETAKAMTMDDALKFAAQFCEQIGIAPGDVTLSDGSGLSRNGLVTPQSVAKLLSYAVKQPWGQALISSLPIAGEDGTLEYRMKGTAAVGRVQAKTGTINSAAGLAGYATSLRGERLVFAFYGNNNPGTARDSTTVLDALCVAMVEELGAQSPATEVTPANLPKASVLQQ